MFDQKSRSSLEKVSVQEQNSTDEDLLHLPQVLERSNKALKEIILQIGESAQVEDLAVELVTRQSKLRSLIIWEWSSEWSRSNFPLSRFVPSDSKDQSSSLHQLQVLWTWNAFAASVDKKHLNSLISFAQAGTITHQECQELISSFSETVVHLSLKIRNQLSKLQPLFCPNLEIFEGWTVGGLSSYFNAPRLRSLVLEAVEECEFEGIPPSVEEIWLRERIGMLGDVEEWEPLLRLCPKLRTLKLTEEFVSETSDLPRFSFTGFLEALTTRRQMNQDGKEMDGIKVVSLEKLILPTGYLCKEDLDRAAKVAEEIIDVKDYPEYIEIKC